MKPPNPDFQNPIPSLAYCLLPTAYLVCILTFILLFLIACSPESNQQPAITQISTIDALMAGCYDGEMPIKNLHQYGDFGIGTYERLDGEMVMLNDTLYQILLDGNAKTHQLPDSTPFASVIRFRPELSIPVEEEKNLDSLRAIIARRLPNHNIFYAVKISGEFKKIKTRSVPSQKKPYAPLNNVLAKQQKILDSENIPGTLVGFFMPAFVQGINVPGYHLHFISNDRKTGGHVFECILSKGTIELEMCRRLALMLPDEKSGFGMVDFAKDRSWELQQVIRLKK